MLKKAISLFLAMAISLMGLSVTALAKGDTDTVSVTANAANKTAGEGIEIGSTGRVETGTPGWITYDFCVNEDGWYNLNLKTSFWWTLGDNGADVSMAIDGGKLIKWSQDTLKQAEDTAYDNSMRNYETLDAFYLSKGVHEIKFVSEYRGNPSWAEFHMESFTFTKTDEIKVAATGAYGEITGWSSDGWNKISTGELGNGKYTFYVPEDGSYALTLNMNSAIDIESGAKAFISVNGGTSTELTASNMKYISESDDPLKEYEYINLLNLVKGYNTVTISTQLGVNDNSKYFHFGNMILSKGNAVTVITNKANAIESDGLEFDSNIYSNKPGYAVYEFDIPESGYYKITAFARFWWQNGGSGAKVSVSTDDGKAVEWQPYTVVDVDGKDTDNKRHFEMRDTFYFEKGSHKIKVQADYFKSTTSAEFFLDNFTFAKTEAITASAMGYYDNDAWEATEELDARWQVTYDHAVTNDIGSASYEVYIPETGAYAIEIDMQCSIDNANVNAKALLSVDGGKKTELSASNTVALGTRAKNLYANALYGYRYSSPLILTKGNHIITITTARGNNTWFNYGGFTLSREDFVTVKATEDNFASVEGIAIGASGRIETGTPGYVTFNFDIPSDGYYNLDMYTAFWWQKGDAGADVSMFIDDGKLINWSSDTLMAMEDSGANGMRTHKALDSFMLTKGTHTIKFVTQYRKNPTWAEFHLERFTFTKTDAIEIAATGGHGTRTGWSSSGWNQISTGELGSGTYTFYAPEDGIYLPTLYMSCGLDNENAGANVYFAIDSGATLALDTSNTKYICAAPSGDSLKIYTVKNPVKLSKGSHTVTISTETGKNAYSTYFWFGKIIFAKTDAEFKVSVANDTLRNGDMTNIESGYMFGIESGMPYGAYATYTSADENIAEVDEEGNIYAYEKGRVVIKTRIHDGNDTTEYENPVYILADGENLIVEDAKIENGKIKVTVGAKGGEQEKAFGVYAAVYNGNKLVNAYTANPNGMTEGSSETYTFDCGEIGSNTVKLFTWRNNGPIYDAESVK